MAWREIGNSYIGSGDLEIRENVHENFAIAGDYLYKAQGSNIPMLTQEFALPGTTPLGSTIHDFLWGSLPLHMPPDVSRAGIYIDGITDGSGLSGSRFGGLASEPALSNAAGVVCYNSNCASGIIFDHNRFIGQKVWLRVVRQGPNDFDPGGRC